MKSYQVIYADPPWQYGSKHYQDGDRDFKDLAAHYDSMTIDNIKALPVKVIADKDAACFMWVTDSHLKEGIEVLESWGFKYKTLAFVWVKKYATGETCVNFAPWTLKSSEVCLLGIKGKMGDKKIANNVRQLIEAERTNHSKKPDEARKRIKLLFGEIPAIELFARERNDGWDAWGNEVKSDIDL